MSKKRLFFKGFGKGLLILVGYIALMVLSTELIPDKNYNAVFQVLGWILWLLIISYLITKYQQPKAFMVVALFTSILLIPFLLGNIELKKNSTN